MRARGCAPRWRRTGEFAGDPAGLHDQDAVGQREDLRQFRGDDNDRETVAGEIVDELIDLGLRADGDATRGLIEGSTPGPQWASPACENDLVRIGLRRKGLPNDCSIVFGVALTDRRLTELGREFASAAARTTFGRADVPEHDE